ncbi:MAG: hypothetical protein Q7V43_26755 [Myxococcales bacterium]|nr:hypothetical protein [Myxococcales bacterium]
MLDAELFGDVRAGEMHGCHRKTIANWRGGDEGPSPAVRAEMDRLRAELRKGWLAEAHDVRRALLQRALVLSRTSKNLRAVTECLRRVNEVVVADEILSDPDAERHLADQQGAAGAPEGEGGEA